MKRNGIGTSNKEMIEVVNDCNYVVIFQLWWEMSSPSEIL